MKLEDYLNKSSKSKNIFDMKLVDILALDDFTIKYKAYSSEYWSDVIFLGLKCHSEFNFENGELNYVSFLPKPEEVGYSNWSGWPDHEYEKAIRDKVEPLLNEKFGEKLKVHEESWLGCDEYEWQYDKYRIIITQTCSNGRDTIVGGEITISKREEDENV